MFLKLLTGRYCLVSGSGDGPSGLTAFDRALMAAGVGDYNLVKVTSILPPGALPGSVNELVPGQVVHAAMGMMTSDQPGELIAAAVAVGLPAKSGAVGVLMEGGFRCDAAEAEERVREMARTALADRGLEAKRIESISAEWRVQQFGAAFAAVMLW